MKHKTKAQPCRDPAVGVRNGEEAEVPASNRDEALFHFVKPSGVPRGPSNSSVSLTSQRHLGSSLRSPVEVEGNECFPPQPKKDLESPSYSNKELYKF